jgi:hypothetical protein
MLGVSVTMFVVGLGIYEGSAFTINVGLNTVNDRPVSNIGVLVPFIVGTLFGWSVLGFLNGRKEMEDHIQKRESPRQLPANVQATTADTASCNATPANSFQLETMERNGTRGQSSSLSS